MRPWMPDEAKLIFSVTVHTGGSRQKANGALRNADFNMEDAKRSVTGLSTTPSLSKFCTGDGLQGDAGLTG